MYRSPVTGIDDACDVASDVVCVVPYVWGHAWILAKGAVVVVGAVFEAANWHRNLKELSPVVVTWSLPDFVSVAFESAVFGSDGTGEWSIWVMSDSSVDEDSCNDPTVSP